MEDKSNIHNDTEVIRVLNFVPIMQPAGIENFIMNLYRNIDRTKIQFDFVVHSKKIGMYDEEIESLGGKIYRLDYKDNKNFIKYVRDLNKFFKEHNEYKIVHGNMQSMMPIYLKVAKNHGVPIRIAHAHNSNYEKSAKGFILHILSKFSKYESNINFACSDMAGKYLFGRKEYIFIPNAIDTERFKYNEKSRNEIREKLKIDKDTLLIGHVGRFELQKNHERLIDIFKELLNTNENCKLILIGTGRLENKIKDKVDRLGIKDKVIFAGVKNNTEDYYSAMDLFLFPSLYEGLPVTGIEAQTSGLNCIMSNSITKETNILNQIEYIDLNKDNSVWVDSVLKNAKKINEMDRLESYKKIRETTFDIKKNAENMENIYRDLFTKG